MSEVSREQLLMSIIAGRGPAYLRGVNLSSMDLSGAGWLVEADLRGADLSSATLRRANLKRANLEMANLHSANLTSADLEGATLFKVRASVANLNMSNLRGANLRQANLSGASLVRADLEDADLEGADLEGANLEGSNLKKARITNVNLKMTNLGGTDLTDAVFECGSIADQTLEWGNEDFHGTLTSIRLPELLQVACLSRSNLNIDVHSAGNQGNIHIGSGRVLHAQTDGIEGEEAFMNILGWEKGRFITFPFVQSKSVTIDKPVEGLLLQWHRLQDEKKFSSRCADLVHKMKKYLPVEARASKDLAALFEKAGAAIGPSDKIEITDLFHSEGDENILCSISTNGQVLTAPLRLVNLDTDHPLKNELTAIGYFA